MLLAIDVGNTNITFGIFDQEKLVTSFRMTTKLPRTSDEYGVLLCQMICGKGFDITEKWNVIISSVVPDIMHSFTNAIVKYMKTVPIMVGIGTKTGIKIVTANPKEIGADRIVDAVGAYMIYGGPVLVIDFGTATTYDVILEDGSFVAGITSPGIRISANALWQNTARLPEIEIEMPKSILAKDTVTSMQAGLLYGSIGQTEYIIKKVKEELKIDDIKVVATGGLGKIISDATDQISIYDPDLTLNGLRLIFNRCRT